MKDVIPKGLVVSCQALKDEPLYGGSTIPKMALAAMMGGAVGIRANTVRDINAISRITEGKLPIIGLIKRVYNDSPVYITPTIKEVKALINSACTVIALDATRRRRPGGATLRSLIAYIRENSEKAIMADIATYEDAMEADALGVDYISTTMRSYTEDTKGVIIPDPEFCAQLLNDVKQATVVAEGGINSFAALRSVLDAGVDHVIIGAAITRPQVITRVFVNVLENHPTFSGETS